MNAVASEAEPVTRGKRRGGAENTWPLVRQSRYRSTWTKQIKAVEAGLHIGNYFVAHVEGFSRSSRSGASPEGQCRPRPPRQTARGSLFTIPTPDFFERTGTPGAAGGAAEENRNLRTEVHAFDCSDERRRAPGRRRTDKRDTSVVVPIFVIALFWRAAGPGSASVSTSSTQCGRSDHARTGSRRP